MICAGCKDTPGHTSNDCEDAKHPHRAYRSCACQHGLRQTSTTVQTPDRSADHDRH